MRLNIFSFNDDILRLYLRSLFSQSTIDLKLFSSNGPHSATMTHNVFSGGFNLNLFFQAGSQSKQLSLVCSILPIRQDRKVGFMPFQRVSVLYQLKQLFLFQLCYSRIRMSEIRFFFIVKWIYWEQIARLVSQKLLRFHCYYCWH